MYLFTLISYGLTMLVNAVARFLSGINGLIGILVFVALAIPLIFLYMLCFLQAFKWLKYMLFCLVPIAILDHFLPLDEALTTTLNLPTLTQKPWILLILLAILVFERICVEYIMMDVD